MSPEVIILQDYDKYMYGRYKRDGPKSAEQFRDDILIPALKKHGVVTIDISMKYGFAGSSSEEIFGGLVRHTDLSSEEILQRLNIVSDCDFKKDAAIRFIKEEGKRK